MSDEVEDTPTMADRLNATGSKLAELSKKAAEATKVAAQKTAEVSIDAAQSATKASKSAVAKTNERVKQAVQDSKDKRNEKRENKAQKAKEELLSESILNDIPAMVTLPEFENERMEVVNEQQSNQLLLLEQMERLSSRIDTLERRQRNSAKNSNSQIIPVEESTVELQSTNDTKQMIGTNEVMGEMLHILGASLLWVVALVGMDQFATDKQLMLTEAYPADLLLWSVGSFTWVMYLLHRLGNPD